MATQDPIQMNVDGATQLVQSRLNKTQGPVAGQEEGPGDERQDVLAIDLPDEELLALASRWTARYAPYEGKIKPRQQANKTYYLGKQEEGTSAATNGQSIAANLIFEAEETFLPAALSKNPEPVVWADNTPEGNEACRAVKTMLQFHADQLALRRKLNLLTRCWSVDFLGVLKHGWDAAVDDIETEVRDAKRFVFDPDGYVDPYGAFVGYLGERITLTAEALGELYPEHAAYIAMTVGGAVGTPVTYTQWWTDEMTFSTYRDVVLEKGRNPHFRYPEAPQAPVEGAEPDEPAGAPFNHFAAPRKPYTFLSVFSFGDQPHDATGLIEQNIPNQRRISRRTAQIDYNLSRQNNSDVFSGENFNQETAKQAADAMAKGNPILVPAGKLSLREAVDRLPAQGMDGSFFAELENSKNDLRQIFGTQGITAMQPDDDQTARGMILNQQYDNSRIGGGVGDALEQVADSVFNWWVHLYGVYYDVPHYAAVMGRLKAVEYVTLQRDLLRRVVVSVAPNSMKPKDEVTLMNQAMALYDKGALDPKTLFTLLDFPDPQQTAEQAVLWKVDPAAYLRMNFPELAARLQAAAMAALPAPGMPAPMGADAPPEAVTEPAPAEGLSVPPAGADLSQVPLPP